MAYRLERLTSGPAGRHARRAVALTVVLLLALLAWRVTRPAPAAPSSAAEQSVVVKAAPFVSTLGVAGVIVPGDSLDIVAPFDGVVQLVGFDYGRAVTAGQVLLTLDPADLQQQLNNAEAASLKATQGRDELAGWASGPEVSRSRRGAASARADLDDARLKIDETKGLLDRGLVARAEYDALVQQQRRLEMAVRAADEDLAASLARGGGVDRRMSNLALSNADAQLARLRSQRQAAVVRAPEAGIMVRPPTEKGQAAAAPHAGGHLARGQLIGTLSRSGSLAVTFRLSETDANRVREGQTVSVTGAGFPDVVLAGHVTSVAGEAESGGATTGGLAAFAATALLTAPSIEKAAAVRIGMSANVVIDLYANPSALTVPPAAIEGAGAAASVIVRDARDGRTRRVAVRLGAVTPDAVEILSGLKSGDRVIWSTPAPATEAGK